jgi:hypothetical protein
MVAEARMKTRMRDFALVLALAGAVIAPGSAQSVRAAAGIPVFSGYWDHPALPGFEPLDNGPTSLRNLSRREGNVSNNMQLVGDYHNPILQPTAAAIVKKFGEMSLGGYGYPTPRNQCWPGGVPFIFTNNGMMMLQKPNEVLILYRVDHQVRHVRLNQAHPARVVPSWYGDSVGHYEGDTLVVDTIGVKIGPYAMVDWYGTPHTAALHVIERYRLLDYEAAKEGMERDARENFIPNFRKNPNDTGKHLQLLFTVEDQGVFTTPWSATITYGRVRPLPGRLGDVAWEEDVCAENPHKYGIEKDVAVPTADRPDF